MDFKAQFELTHLAAMTQTGLSDFGPPDYVEPMKLALSDLAANGRLNDAGEQMWIGWITDRLVARLLAHDGFKRQSAPLPIRRPIIVVGMMRTGTTALLRLLSRDPANQSLEFWLCNTPMTRPPRSDWADNPWYQRTAQRLEQTYSRYPLLKQLHPQDAAEADECHHALQSSFWSDGLSCLARVPVYRDWFTSADPLEPNRYHRRLLELIAGADGRRWVLKDPAHLWSIDALLEVFPDACIVFTHRDIATSMGSMASLIYEMRRNIEPSLTPQELGREMIDFWGKALTRAEAARKRHDPARFFDVHISQLQADPMATVESVYRHFDLPFDDLSRAALRAHIQADARAGHGKHHYRARDFGITEKNIAENIGAYFDRNKQLCAEFG